MVRWVRDPPVSWMHGYGHSAARPAVRPSVPAIAPLACPKCQAEAMRIRSSTDIKTRMECAACGHQWDHGGKVRRVFLPVV